MRSTVTQPSAQESLIVEHLDLVRTVANCIARTLPSFVEIGDLIQAGTLGLIHAARKFDPAQNVVFSTYAKHRIRGAILDSLRSEDPLSRDTRAYKKKIQSATQRVEQREQREAAAHEIASALGLEVAHLNAIQMRIQQARRVWMDQVSEDGLPKMDFPDRPQDRPDAILERHQITSQVRGAMDTLPERHRLTLHLYYVEELTMKEIGVVLGVNESRVSQIHKSATKTMAAHLRTNRARCAAA